MQPCWAPDGRLVFLSDRTGWWNLYAANLGDPDGGPDRTLVRVRRVRGIRSGCWGPRRTASATAAGWCARGPSTGMPDWGSLDLVTGERAGDHRTRPRSVRSFVSGESRMLRAGYADLPPAWFGSTSSTGPDHRREARLDRRRWTRVWSASPEPVRGTRQTVKTVYGFYNAPRQPDFAGAEGERPPLIVASHGGPTGMSKPGFDSRVQYWTSRGFAVLDVNYGGSSGYGRAYRERLSGQWGIVDVEDCVSGALAMVEAGRADPRAARHSRRQRGRLHHPCCARPSATSSRPAPAYSVWATWRRRPKDTHKFESRYLDGLIGPYPQAAGRSIVERSPIHHVDRLSCPMILFQGTDDLVVPRNQAETMAAACGPRGCRWHCCSSRARATVSGKAENIVRALEAEAYFYSRVFGFELADAVEPRRSTIREPCPDGPEASDVGGCHSDRRNACPSCASPWPRSTRRSATSRATSSWWRTARRGRRRAGAHLVACPRWWSPATRWRTWRCGRASSRPRARRPTRLASRLAAEGLGELTVVTRLPRPRRRRARPTGPPEGLAAERGRGHHTRAGRRPLCQAPPAELRSLRRVPVLRARPRDPRRAHARHRRRRLDLRGHLAGRAQPRGARPPAPV